MTLDEKLAHFKESALKDATAQSEEIITKCKEDIQQKYDDYKEEAQTRNENKIKMTTNDLIKKKNQALSKDSLEIKRKLSKKREELTNSIFKDVEKKLFDYKKSPKYKDLLCSQIKKALDFSDGSKIIVYIDASDETLKKELSKSFTTNVTFEISDTKLIGGTKIIIKDKNILLDNSFATKLAEEKSTFTL